MSNPTPGAAHGPAASLRSPLSSHFVLEPGTTFLNHGSFGACPRAVLDEQDRLRARLEAQPVRFFVRELEPLLDAARARLAGFVGASAEDLAFVPNATAGVNAVLGSIPLAPGDELLTTDHAYNACANVLRGAAARTGARVVVVPVPFPLDDSDAGRADDRIVDAILAGVTARTRLALVDHVTSPTALVLPVARLVAALRARGVETLVDGAHAPGMVPLDLDALGAAWFTGNCHKWVCAPKGAAFLHARRDMQAALHPSVTSHGANSARRDRSRFLLEFDWTGTGDPTAPLCIPAALDTIAAMVRGGWPEVMAKNHALAVEARALLAGALDLPIPAPAALLGLMAALPLPPLPRSIRRAETGPAAFYDPLQEALFARGIEVPVTTLAVAPTDEGVAHAPGRYLRLSAQLYNALPEYARLAEAVRDLLVSEQAGAAV